MCFIGAPNPSIRIQGRSDCTTTLHVVDLHSLSQHLLHSTIQRKDMITNDDNGEEDKVCPHCRKTFSTHSARNKHLQRNVCHKSVSRTPSSRNSPPPPPDLPAILLKEDHEGLLMGHNCPYSKYKLFLLSLSSLTI